MNKVIEIINQLRSESSTNGKIAILKANKDNELLKNVLYYTYADNLQFGMREATISPTNNEFESIVSIFELLDRLASSNINDELRKLTNTYLGGIVNKDERELYINILTKDLRCNISTKTINKAIKGLIPEWGVQQAYPIDKVKLKKNEWIALSLKLNGIRSTLFNGEFKSRQNKVMNGFDHIKKDLEVLMNELNLSNYVFDGEMIRYNHDGVPDNENFRLTTSIVNSDNEEKKDVQFVIFDLLPKDEFIKGESNDTFRIRLGLLTRIDEKIRHLGLNNITVAPTYYNGTDHSQISKLLTEVDKAGFEGLMLLRDMRYKNKRHNGIAKCKKFYSADCLIVGYEEGTKKYEKMLGSFIIDYKGNQVNVGSGYSDEQRQEMWDNRDKYIGRILEVKYKEESHNKKDNSISLQFPTFVCIREYGKEVSYN